MGHVCVWSFYSKSIRTLIRKKWLNLNKPTAHLRLIDDIFSILLNLWLKNAFGSLKLELNNYRK